MIWPPSLLRVRIAEKGKKRIGLWIPIFLLWPVAMALAVVLTPFLLVFALTQGRRAGAILAAGPLLFVALCRARGLRVYVQDRDDQIYIAVW